MGKMLPNHAEIPGLLFANSSTENHLVIHFFPKPYVMYSVEAPIDF